MVEVKYITTPTEIPGGPDYILVMRGEENEQTRHSRGITITVARGLSDNISELSFLTAIESAKVIAKREGIATVFACK